MKGIGELPIYNEAGMIDCFLIWNEPVPVRKEDFEPGGENYDPDDREDKILITKRYNSALDLWKLENWHCFESEFPVERRDKDCISFEVMSSVIGIPLIERLSKRYPDERLDMHVCCDGAVYELQFQGGVQTGEKAFYDITLLDDIYDYPEENRESYCVEKLTRARKRRLKRILRDWCSNHDKSKDEENKLLECLKPYAEQHGFREAKKLLASDDLPEMLLRFTFDRPAMVNTHSTLSTHSEQQGSVFTISEKNIARKDYFTEEGEFDLSKFAPFNRKSQKENWKHGCQSTTILSNDTIRFCTMADTERIMESHNFSFSELVPICIARRYGDEISCSYVKAGHVTDTYYRHGMMVEQMWATGND